MHESANSNLIFLNKQKQNSLAPNDIHEPNTSVYSIFGCPGTFLHVEVETIYLSTLFKSTLQSNSAKRLNFALFLNNCVKICREMFSFFKRSHNLVFLWLETVCVSFKGYF